MDADTFAPDLAHALLDPSAPAEGGGRRSLIVLYAGVHLLPLLAFWTGVTFADAALCLVLLYVRGLCMSAGYHRYFAHRSFRTGRVLQFLLAVGGCTTLRGGPLWWTAMHRHHHRFSDLPVDVHGPGKGLAWSYLGWICSGWYCRTPYRLVKDWAKYPELRWLNRWWLTPPALLALGTYLVGGGSALAVGFGLSTVLLFQTQCWMDVLVHRFGSRRYDTPDTSCNSWLVSLLSMGEGWHNNHHKYPASCRSGFGGWEIDGTYDALRFLAAVGLVWGLRTPPKAVLTRIQVRD